MRAAALTILGSAVLGVLTLAGSALAPAAQPGGVTLALARGAPATPSPRWSPYPPVKLSGARPAGTPKASAFPPGARRSPVGQHRPVSLRPRLARTGLELPLQLVIAATLLCAGATARALSRQRRGIRLHPVRGASEP